MSFEHLSFEQNTESEKASAELVAQTQERLTSLDQQVQDVLADHEDLDINPSRKREREIRQFVQSAVKNKLNGHLDQFNAEAFDNDGEAGLDKYEFEQFSSSLDAAIDQIILLDGMGAFKDAHKDANTDGRLNVLGHASNKLNAVTGEALDGLLGENNASFTELLLNKSGIDDESLRLLREKKFKVSDSMSWSEVILLTGIEVGEGVEDIIRLAVNIPGATLRLPEYIKLRGRLNSSDPEKSTRARIALDALVEKNPVLGIAELLGEKGIQAIKQIGKIMVSGKQGDLALVLATLAGLIAGGAGVAKLGTKLARRSAVKSARKNGTGSSGRAFRNSLRDASRQAGKVQAGADKVDALVSTGGIAGIGYLKGESASDASKIDATTNVDGHPQLDFSKPLQFQDIKSHLDGLGAKNIKPEQLQGLFASNAGAKAALEFLSENDYPHMIEVDANSLANFFASDPLSETLYANDRVLKSFTPRSLEGCLGYLVESQRGRDIILSDLNRFIPQLEPQQRAFVLESILKDSSNPSAHISVLHYVNRSEYLSPVGIDIPMEHLRELAKNNDAQKMSVIEYINQRPDVLPQVDFLSYEDLIKIQDQHPLVVQKVIDGLYPSARYGDVNEIGRRLDLLVGTDKMKDIRQSLQGIQDQIRQDNIPREQVTKLQESWSSIAAEISGADNRQLFDSLQHRIDIFTQQVYTVDNPHQISELFDGLTSSLQNQLPDRGNIQEATRINEGGTRISTGVASDDILTVNGTLSDASRIEAANQLLGRRLTQTQEVALMKAHNVQQGNNVEKGLILMREGGFTKAETKILMDQGLAGRFKDRQDFAKHIDDLLPVGHKNYLESLSRIVDRDSSMMKPFNEAIERTGIIDNRNGLSDLGDLMYLMQQNSVDRRGFQKLLSEMKTEQDWNDLVEVMSEKGTEVNPAPKSIEDIRAALDKKRPKTNNVDEGVNVPLNSPSVSAPQSVINDFDAVKAQEGKASPSQLSKQKAALVTAKRHLKSLDKALKNPAFNDASTYQNMLTAVQQGFEKLSSDMGTNAGRQLGFAYKQRVDNLLSRVTPVLEGGQDWDKVRELTHQILFEGK